MAMATACSFFQGKYHCETVLGDKAKEQNKSLALAAGASAAGMAIFGPIGIIDGAFGHDQGVVIPIKRIYYSDCTFAS